MAYKVRSTAKRHIVENHGACVAEIATCFDRAEAENIAYLLNNQPNMVLASSRDELVTALADLADVFAHDGENSLDRFERLAAMFRRDTGYLAPGKDRPMCGPDQPDGDELRAIYDDWYAAKVTRARAALAERDQAR